MGRDAPGGRISDRSSPFKEDPLPAGSLYIADLGYLDWGTIAARRAAGSYTLTRAQARTLYWTTEGKPLQLDPLLPQQVGQTKELWVRVGDEHRHLMRLLILRVPPDVAERRRAALEADAKRRGQPVRERAWKLADWTLLLTDVPTNLLNLQEALVLLRERWQMEMLVPRCGSTMGGLMNGAQLTLGACSVNCMPSSLGFSCNTGSCFCSPRPGRAAQFGQTGKRRVRDTAGSLLEALAGVRSLRSALQVIQRRMRSGCQLNKRKKYPNAAQLLQRGSTNWALSP